MKLDMAALMAAKDNSVKSLTGGIKMLFKNNKVTHLEGKATVNFLLKESKTCFKAATHLKFI